MVGAPSTSASSHDEEACEDAYYVAYEPDDAEQAPPRADSCQSDAATAILLAVGLGLGAHASKESLAPSEHALEALGLSPIVYASLTLAPVALGLVSPVLWGKLWDCNPRWVFIFAPIGELVGATLIAGGLQLLQLAQSQVNLTLGGDGGVEGDSDTDIVLLIESGHASASSAVLLCGLLFTSACRAGIAVAEFGTIGKVSGANATLGFAALVVAKHAMSIALSWSVPRVLTGVHSTLGGVIRVQMMTLLPHAVALACGLTLSCQLPPPAPHQSHHKGLAAAAFGAGGRNPPASAARCSFDATAGAAADSSVAPSSDAASGPAASSMDRNARGAALAQTSASPPPPPPAQSHVAPSPSRMASEGLLAALSAPSSSHHRAGADEGRAGGGDSGRGGGSSGGRRDGDDGKGFPAASPAAATTLATTAASGSGGGSAGGSAGAPNRAPTGTPLVAPVSVTSRSWLVVVLIGAWRAVEVGTLHAYHAVRVELLVSRGLTLTAAGSLVATNDALAMLALPLACALSRLTGLRPLLLATSLLSLAAAVLLAHSHAAAAAPDAPGAGAGMGVKGRLDQPLPSNAASSDTAGAADGGDGAADGIGAGTAAAAFILSLMEVSAPVIPLALLPANASSLGTAYGAIEVMFVVSQLTITLLVGVLRQSSHSFDGALGLMWGGFAAAFAVAMPLAAHTTELAVPSRSREGEGGAGLGAGLGARWCRWLCRCSKPPPGFEEGWNSCTRRWQSCLGWCRLRGGC